MEERYIKAGRSNSENGRWTFFNRVNSGEKFQVESIDNVPRGANNPVIAKCLNCGETVEISRKRALDGTCPLCGNFESSNEHLIAKILDDSNVKYIREYKVDYENADMKFQLLDFYLPEHNLAIEHQGNQHYNPKNGLYSEDVVRRDELKREQVAKLGINLAYTYENGGLIFDQLQDILWNYGVFLNKVIGSKYPPAQEALDFVEKNQDKSYQWFLDKLHYGNKTFDRYLKMTGLVGYVDALSYFRWKEIPDDEFLDYLSENGIRKTAKHFNRTIKTTTTHMYDLGYQTLLDLQIERKLVLEAFPDDIILNLVSQYSIKESAERLGFKKYHLEHYLPKIGYKNRQDVLANYHPTMKGNK